MQPHTPHTPQTTQMPPRLCVVVPCYNEEEALPLTLPALLKQLDSLAAQGKISAAGSSILLVDDGSTDGTWDLIASFSGRDARVIGISLSRNRGHQNALYAGLMHARQICDISISIDADGQDDLQAMHAMVDAYLTQGCQIVYGVRQDRRTDSVFKRNSAQGFYHLQKLLGIQTAANHADYRLLSARVLEELAAFPEANLYLRGLVPLVGFVSTTVAYTRSPRVAGSSHYPLKRMLALGLDGITSLTIRPIRIIGAFGLIAAAVSLLGIIWALISHFAGSTISGWTSMLCVVCFIGSIQLICLGVIGEYVGKTYLESKHRPRFIVEKTAGELSSLRDLPAAGAYGAAGGALNGTVRDTAGSTGTAGSTDTAGSTGTAGNTAGMPSAGRK